MEPPYNEEPRHWQNLFAITRFRYIEVLFHVFCCYWGKQNPSLYRGLRYIEVPLYWNVSSWDAVASFIGNTAFSLTLSVSTLRNRRIVLVHQHGRCVIVLEHHTAAMTSCEKCSIKTLSIFVAQTVPQFNSREHRSSLKGDRKMFNVRVLFNIFYYNKKNVIRHIGVSL